METGRKHDIVFQKYAGVTSYGQEWDAGWKVWADPGFEQNFKQVEGIVKVQADKWDVPYIVEIDPRYDEEFVLNEIECIVKYEKPLGTSEEEEE